MFSLSIQHEITLQSQPLDVIKCLLQSEVLLNDFKRIVELIEMYPSAYEEIMNCIQTDINLQSLYYTFKPHYSSKVIKKGKTKKIIKRNILLMIFPELRIF